MAKNGFGRASLRDRRGEINQFLDEELIERFDIKPGQAAGLHVCHPDRDPAYRDRVREGLDQEGLVLND